MYIALSLYFVIFTRQEQFHIPHISIEANDFISKGNLYITTYILYIKEGQFYI